MLRPSRRRQSSAYGRCLRLGAPEGERAEIERRRLVLAIESSCDETAVAIIDADGNMLANQVSTQIDFHARFGGVVPDRLAQTR